MLQVIFALIAIGMALFLWQAFPAFKWILAVIVIIPIVFIGLEVYQNHARVEKAEREERGRVEVQNKADAERRAKALAQFDLLALVQSNDMPNNNDIFISEAKNGTVVLTSEKCKMGEKLYKNLQHSYLDTPAKEHFESCWAFDNKKNVVVLITYLDTGSFKSEIGFNYFSSIIWDSDKKKNAEGIK